MNGFNLRISYSYILFQWWKMFKKSIFFLCKMKKKESHEKQTTLEKIKSLYWLWFSIIGFVILILLAFMLLFFHLRKKYDDSNESCANDFDISKVLVFDSNNNNTFCMKSLTYKQIICFQLTQANEVVITFGSAGKKNFGDFDKLPDNENAEPQYNVVGQKLLIFRYPFAKSTVAIYNKTNTNSPGRLCYNFDEQVAFISAPTVTSIKAT